MVPRATRRDGVDTLKRLLWVGDAGCASGFGLATHKITETLVKHYNLTVLAMNWRGDPVGFPEHLRNRMWAAAPGGDSFGTGRLIWMCDVAKPDLIVLQNDGWNIQAYLKQLRRRLSNGEYAFPDYAGIPVVAIVAVDGKNFRGEWLNGVSSAIFWTQFALDEARKGGYAGPATVIPLGVDLDLFKPIDKVEARRRRGLPPHMDETFIVGNVNRNQPRKRWDLTIKYFAEWVTGKNIKDACLFLHCAPTGDTGTDVRQLAKYYGVLEMLALMEPPLWFGIPDDEVRDTYNCFDVAISTTQGEGFGLTALEAMACGVACVMPGWAALGEWAAEGALMVPCTSTAVGPPYVNVIGGVPDEDSIAIKGCAISSPNVAGGWPSRHVIGGRRLDSNTFQCLTQR
jgi:glycosyltransferase involved in cell wall biosynthesis